MSQKQQRRTCLFSSRSNREENSSYTATLADDATPCPFSEKKGNLHPIFSILRHHESRRTRHGAAPRMGTRGEILKLFKSPGALYSPHCAQFVLRSNPWIQLCARLACKRTKDGCPVESDQDLVLSISKPFLSSTEPRITPAPPSRKGVNTSEVFAGSNGNHASSRITRDIALEIERIRPGNTRGELEKLFAPAGLMAPSGGRFFYLSNPLIQMDATFETENDRDGQSQLRSSDKIRTISRPFLSSESTVYDLLR